MIKRIAIIGAGWMGIGCLSVLIQRGHHVDVYEKEDNIGGVWHPKNWYVGLSLHGLATTVEYHDFPLPSSIDKSSSMSAEQIYEYLKSYCEFKQLYKHMNFNSTVTKINYHSERNTCSIDIIKNNVFHESIEYDYIIYTHGFTDRSIPKIKGQDNFLGSLYHSFDINESVLKSITDTNKKVIIVGAGKTATDIILIFEKLSYHLVWLYKKNYWFFRESFYRKAIKNKLLGRKINLHLLLFKLVEALGKRIRKRSLKFYFSLLLLFNLIHTYGKKHLDFKKYHGGRIEDFQMAILANCNKKYHLNGEIDLFIEDGLKLKDGRTIKTDCVIFCTGSAGCHALIPVYIDNKPFPLDKINKMFRSRVIPDIPALIFTAFSDFNIGTINGLLYGEWIATYINQNLTKKYLAENVITFLKPFFSSMHLFDSSDYFHVRHKYMLAAFFESGELSAEEITKWAWEYNFSGHSIKPYKFSEIKCKNLYKNG